MVRVVSWCCAYIRWCHLYCRSSRREGLMPGWRVSGPHDCTPPDGVAGGMSIFDLRFAIELRLPRPSGSIWIDRGAHICNHTC